MVENLFYKFSYTEKKVQKKKEENEIKTRRKLLAFVGCFCFVLCLFGIQIENTMHEWPIYFAIALGYFENSSQPLSSVLYFELDKTYNNKYEVRFVVCFCMHILVK